MVRTIRERMNVRDNEVFTPADLINAKTLSFRYQFILRNESVVTIHGSDKSTCEITHKRRLSALGPGGLPNVPDSRVRDVHYTLWSFVYH